LVTEYIEAQRGVGELEKWTVVLINNKDNARSPTKSHDFGGGLVVGLVYAGGATAFGLLVYGIYRLIRRSTARQEESWK
jgi:hypothetical protein